MEVIVGRSTMFARQDMDIFSSVSISFPQAALGGDLRIATVDGDVIYTIKPGTQSGTRVRLKGKGVPSLRNKNVRGDHYVTLLVEVPTKLSEEAKQALRAYDMAAGNSLKQGKNQEAGPETGEKPKKKVFLTS